MQKRHVFVVTGRELINGVPRGPICTVVVCSDKDNGVRTLLAEKRPAFGITTITGLAALEGRVKKIKDTLSQSDTEWDVLVDPKVVPDGS